MHRSKPCKHGGCGSVHWVGFRAGGRESILRSPGFRPAAGLLAFMLEGALRHQAFLGFRIGILDSDAPCPRRGT